MGSQPSEKLVEMVAESNEDLLEAFFDKGTLPKDDIIRGLRGATIEIPYPWVEGEAHEIKLVSRNGVAFFGEIEVASGLSLTETVQISNEGSDDLHLGAITIADDALGWKDMDRHRTPLPALV